MKLNSIKIILYLSLVVFLLIQIYEISNDTEFFTENNIVGNKNIKIIIELKA